MAYVSEDISVAVVAMFLQTEKTLNKLRSRRLKEYRNAFESTPPRTNQSRLSVKPHEVMNESTCHTVVQFHGAGRRTYTYKQVF